MNYTVEDYTENKPSSYIDPDSVFSLRKRDADELKLNIGRENANVVEKLNAATDSFQKSNFIARGIEFIEDKVNTRNFEPNKDFPMDDDFAFEVMHINGLAPNTFPTIRSVKSQEELNYRVERLKEEQAIDERIHKTLTDDETIASSIAGSFFDIDLGVGLATGGLSTVSKSFTIMKAIGMNAGIELALAGVKSAIDDDYTLEDGAFDVFAGLAGASGVTYLSARKYKKAIMKGATENVDELKLLEYKGGKKEIFEAQQKAINDARIKANRTAFYEKQKAYNDAKTLAEKNKLADELDDITLEHSKELKAIDEMEYRIVREQELKPLRSKTYAKNRSAFFKIQDELSGGTKAIEDELTALAMAQELVEVGSKKADELAKKIEKLKSKKAIDSNMNKWLNQSDFIRIVDEMDGDVKKLRTDLDTYIKEVGEEELIEVMDGFRKTHPKEIEAIEELLTVPLDDKSLKSFKDSLKGMGYKPMALTSLALLMGGEAQADDGEISTGSILAGLVMATSALVLTPSALRAIKNKSIGKMLNKMSAGWKEATTRAEYSVTPEASQIRKMSATVTEVLNTRMTSTIDPIKNSSKEANDIVDKLLYSADTGTGAEIEKQSWVHATMNKYANTEKEGFAQWKANRGIGWIQSWTDESSSIHGFRREMTDAIEMIKDNPEMFKKLDKDTQKTAKELDIIKKEIYDRTVEYKVYAGKNKDGSWVEGIEHQDGMIPRYWKNVEMNGFLNATDKAGIKKIRKALADGFFKGGNKGFKTTYYYADKAGKITKTRTKLENTKKTLVDTKITSRSEEIADRFVDDWLTGRNLSTTSVTKSQDLYASIEGLLKDDVDVSDLADALSVDKDITARAKKRLGLDLSALDGLEININGVPTILNKSDFVERDIKVIMDRTANSLHGQSALAKADWKTTKQLEDAIDNVPHPNIREELRQIKDLVLGIPIASKSPWLHEISMISKDALVISRLPLVLFSTPPELINAITHQGFTKSLRNFFRLLTINFGENSNLTQMIEMSGLGTSLNRLDFTGFRGFTDTAGDLDDVQVLSSIRSGTMKMRDASIYLNQLGRFSDVLQKAGMEMNLEKIANYIHKGDTTASGLEPSRMKQWGITEDFVKRFKNKIKFNEDGSLAILDSKNWSIRDRDDFASVLRVMNQQISPETTIGGTPLFSRTTDLGRAISGLLTYPMMQFNEYGLADLKHLDKRAVIHSMGAFAGSYLGLKARYALQGKDVDEETIVTYALLNIPQAGLFTSIRGMLDPAMFSMAQEAFNIAVPKDLEIR